MLKKYLIIKLCYVTGFIFLIGCSSNKTEPKVEQPNNISLPSWVFQPEIKDGIAAAQCVKFSGNVSLDQQEVTAKGRASLAQQINTRAAVMDKTYQNRTDTNETTVTGNVFESVSKQVSNQTLVGSKLMKTEFGSVNKVQYLCGLVGITPEETKKLFNTIVSAEQAPKTNAQDKDVLYQEFKAFKAQQELDQAIGTAK